MPQELTLNGSFHVRLSPLALFAPFPPTTGSRMKSSFSIFSVVTTGVLLSWIMATATSATADNNNTASTPSNPSNSSVTLADDDAGKAIFESQCATCHGGQGQGNVEFYPDPLIGDASIGELAQVIIDTMPEEDPDACVGEDAVAVASYIHRAFYSEAAQLRNRPPRLALQRLTGNQLRNSLHNLYSHFAGIQPDPWAERIAKQGVEVTYYNGKGWEKKDHRFNGIVDQIQFDYSVDPPRRPDGSELDIDREEFHAHFKGGLRIEHTGRYELVVRSTSSFEMIFGHDRRQLIDNHVTSEGRNEFRRTLWLTAGRTYPVRLDLNQRKRKGETPPSTLSVSWVPPGGVETLIPRTNWVPGWVPMTASIQTQMPPDDRSYGFERGIGVDAAWDESVTSSALELATLVCDELWPDYLNRTKKEERPRNEKLKTLLTDFISVAHRGDAESVNASEIVDAIMTHTKDEHEIIKYAVLLTIKSPRFLYPAIDSDRNQSWRASTRLSMTLHDATPGDDWLIRQCVENQLNAPEAVRRAATRMVDDARTRAKWRDMLYHWLDVSTEDDLRKDESKFAGFDAAMISDLRQSLDAFIDEVVWSDASDFRQLVGADWALTTPRLTDFYGDGWKPSDEPGSVSSLNPNLTRTVRDGIVHQGVITHPLVMARLAHHQETSPIHRGVFLIRHVMGRTLRPPNEAFAPLSPDLHPDLTNRERVALQTSPDSCQICHSKINPLGFTMEEFDAVGRYRQQEGVNTIDASGHYVTRDDERIDFQTVRDLADYVAGSSDAQTAFVSRVFQYFTKQPIAAYGAERLEDLTDRFQDSNYNLRELLIEIAVIASEDPSPNS